MKSAKNKVGHPHSGLGYIMLDMVIGLTYLASKGTISSRLYENRLFVIQNVIHTKVKNEISAH